MTIAVLVLHGYAQNANIFSKRISALRKKCAKDIEFVFLDGPHILQGDDLFGEPEDAKQESPDGPLRGWWRAFADKNSAVGIEDSLALIRDTLKERRFSGIFGFSQGAAMATVAAALLEHPETYPPFLIDGQAPHPPFEFCLSVAGFRPRDPLCDKIFSESYSTPTLHLMGCADTIVPAGSEISQNILLVSANKRVVVHDGGHFVPSKGPWRNFLHAYLKDHTTKVAPPESAPPSGTTTPET